MNWLRPSNNVEQRVGIIRGDSFPPIAGNKRAPSERRGPFIARRVTRSGVLRFSVDGLVRSRLLAAADRGALAGADVDLPGLHGFGNLAH